MHLRKILSSALAASCAFAMVPMAFGHVSVRGPGFADTSQVLTFPIGHGCAGADTFKLEIHLPESVTSARAMPGSFGDAEGVLNDQLLPTSIIWEKATVKPADDQYYEFHARIRIPDAPFTTIYFPATQVCRDGADVETTVEWSDIPPATGGEPAAALAILPPRVAIAVGAESWVKY